MLRCNYYFLFMYCKTSFTRNLIQTHRLILKYLEFCHKNNMRINLITIWGGKYNMFGARFSTTSKLLHNSLSIVLIGLPNTATVGGKATPRAVLNDTSAVPNVHCTRELEFCSIEKIFHSEF